MSQKEHLDIYKDTLLDCLKYHPESIGFTTYIGASGSDKTYPKMLNFQTNLLLEIYQKISTLETSIKRIEDKNLGAVTQRDLKELINSVNSKGKEIVPYKPSYLTW